MIKPHSESSKLIIPWLENKSSLPHASNYTKWWCLWIYFQVNWVTSASAEKKNKKNKPISQTRKCTVNKIMLSTGLDSSSGQTYFTNRQVSYDSIFPKHTDQRHPDTNTKSQRRVNICVHNSDHKLQTPRSKLPSAAISCFTVPHSFPASHKYAMVLCSYK